MGDDRPFVCTAPGCGQRFTNEDHLAVHKHKHEMTLKFGQARTDTVIIADQTPTPTRFLKNCEEVGLFSELAGSFEQDLRKTQEVEERRIKGKLPALQTPTEVKEREGPLEIDSSPLDSPDSASSMTNSKDAVAMAKDPVAMRKMKDFPPRTAASSTPTPTIVRPGSLPLHQGFESMNPTQPSPTSVITRTPPSNRLSSPSGSFPMLMQLPNGQAVPLLPSPGQTSVISLARSSNTVPNIPGIPGPPICGSSSGSSSPSGYSTHSEAKTRLKAALSQQSPSGPSPIQKTDHTETPSPAQPQVSPAPPKGGRRRRGADIEPDERRRRFLERNRAAASRCRQKRKVWVSALEKRAEELATSNVNLTSEVSLLRTEVTRLKELLLAHKDCPVTTMQKKAYLAAGVDENSASALVMPVSVPAPVSVNGLSVRAAEAVAVLAGMGSGQWSNTARDASSQSQSTSR
ncbi:cyclic AMP-dependent transcription factor ATF-7-like isoform X1 [Myxocyprinus asiaticus]|uniref:cyclic AMP-dependent transcription factor ATF-7-like isoform X1 n=1 Tax=Myxocyprinus asiaticus TaxID=70543 RepID=UPI00222328DF|nr:cyclic AMP-dependent transcription factor ATF-7-like isoform X1 [Myxocyprinus asiaticus]XP_051562794.1 cyclic AMP-dependent transcription factor ATF-7-like isoform X1 [Myxocyprinus asiaticus]XP_051562795.1 cyclic AMP-dependent transcription factor ATF-7-like isoform X1 [Myxocyprinus asiaticus]